MQLLVSLVGPHATKGAQGRLAETRQRTIFVQPLAVHAPR